MYRILTYHSGRSALAFLVLVFCCLSDAIGQDNAGIDMKEIRHRKVRRYLLRSDIDKMQDFSSIQPSCSKGDHETGLKVNEKVFFLKSRLSTSWNGYLKADPVQAFNCRSFRLELMILKNNNKVFYKKNTSLPVIDTGQLYFFDIRLMKGLVNVPMAFEVINIDQEQKVLEMSYIEGNKARGKQQIRFSDSGDGRTMVVHKSYFKSHSWLRDTFFYPYFHRRLVKEYHRKMEQIVGGKKPDLITVNGFMNYTFD